jgi:hypothetical protein
MHCPAVHIYMHEGGRTPVHIFYGTDVSYHEPQPVRFAGVPQLPRQPQAAILFGHIDPHQGTVTSQSGSPWQATDDQTAERDWFEYWSSPRGAFRSR